MIGVYLLLIEDDVADILRLNPIEVGESKSGKAAQNKQIPEPRPFRMGRQIQVIQGADFLSGQIDRIRLFIQDLKIAEVNGRNDLPTHAVPEEDPELLYTRPYRIPFQPTNGDIPSHVHVLIGQV